MKPLRPWSGWKILWAVWRVGFVGVLALTPFLASDFCVLLPSMMLYLAAGGPLRAYARTPPTCGRCSLDLVEGVRHAPDVRA